jgi:hypothetical protein
MMKRLFIVFVAVLLLAGCIQTEGRYDVVGPDGNTIILVDRQIGLGCLWVLDTRNGFVALPIYGLHGGKAGDVPDCMKPEWVRVN